MVAFMAWPSLRGFRLRRPASAPQSRLALIFGSTINIDGLTETAAANLVIDCVVKLQHSVGIRTRLRDLGLPSEKIPLVAHRAFQIKRLMDLNPRRATESDLMTILENAF